MVENSTALNARIRSSAFAWLKEQVERLGDVLPRPLLAKGFEFEGERVPLLAPQGIFKPKVLTDGPLSIATTPESPYSDALGKDGLLRYSYRGTNIQHRDNVGLRNAMSNRLPLVYFHGLVPGKYLATWPVFVVGDDPARLTFTVAVDDAQHIGLEVEKVVAMDPASEDLRRRYATAAVRVRLHQRSFRERVLSAYKRQCAFCRFRHEEMLDAAHIVPDSHPEGEPSVRNGLALCTLHHAAFDRYFVGLRPDYVLEVRPDLLQEKDGPTLVGIQSLHGKRMVLPAANSHHPDSKLLSVRYQSFLNA
jgi:putative restriction endonuclease